MESKDSYSHHDTMPVIKILDPGGPQQRSGLGSHLAAAVMAVALSKGSEPVKAAAKQVKRTRPETTRPGNPNGLAIKQHVFPLKTMEQFTQGGRLSVYLIAHCKLIPAKPNNSLFYACRAWDERVESGYMKRIEDEFQAIVAPVIYKKVVTIASEQKPVIDRMYALWYMRSRYRDLEEQEIPLNGIVGDALTKEQEENLEKNGYIFARKGGRMPARQLNGVQLQMRIDAYARQLVASVPRWGIISTQSGEFMVPDAPSYTIIPLSPHLALVGSASDGVITDQNLAEINRAASASSREYFFARDFSKCPA
jgi:hypothetical protein